MRKFAERRRYIRLPVPIDMSYTISGNNKIHSTATKDISADGLRFIIHDKFIKESDLIELRLNIPNIPSAIHAKGRVVWKRKLSLEDRAPFDVGIEFSEIEEDNKNTFLKFLCDLIYNLPEDTKHASKKAHAG